MNPTTPIEIDGVVYDRYDLNLAITGLVQPAGWFDGQISLRLVPVRITEGVVIPAHVEQPEALIDIDDPTNPVPQDPKYYPEVRGLVVERRQDRAFSMNIGSTATADPITQQCVVAIRDLLQQWINEKGL